jgi:hypothetical protein
MAWEVQTNEGLVKGCIPFKRDEMLSIEDHAALRFRITGLVKEEHELEILPGEVIITSLTCVAWPTGKESDK